MSQSNVSTRANPLVRQWRLILGLAISALFLVWLWRQVGDLSAIGSALREANYLYVLPALAVYFFGVWIRAVRWHYLLKPLKSVSPNRLFPVVVIGYMANDVLPARLGEFVRAYVLGDRERLPAAAILGTIVVERTLDGIAMLIFVIVATLFIPLDPQLQRVFQIAAAVFVGAIAVFVVLASSRTLALSVIGALTRPLPERPRMLVASVADRFLAGFHALRSIRLTLAALSLSVAAWLAEAGMYLIVGTHVFGLTLPPSAYVLTTAFANLFAMVPSAPGYIGPFDAGALGSLALFGLTDSGVGAAYVFVLHIALLIPVSLLGFVYLWRYGLSIRTLWSSKSRSEG